MVVASRYHTDWHLQMDSFHRCKEVMVMDGLSMVINGYRVLSVVVDGY